MVRRAKAKRWPRMRALALRKVRSSWEKASRWQRSRRPRASSRGVALGVSASGAGLIFSGMSSASGCFSVSGRGCPSTAKEAEPSRYAFTKNAKLQGSRFRGNDGGREDSCVPAELENALFSDGLGITA